MSPGTTRWTLALVFLSVLIRLPALGHPRMIDDEQVYSVVAIEMLEGGKPYLDAVERKPPLLFWTYAGLLGLVGRYNAFGLHVAGVLWVLLTMGGLYATARALFDRTTGFCAALLYAVYQPWLFYHNLALNGEVLMNLPIAWAAYLTLRPARSRIRPELVAAGSLLCLAFLLKQPAAIASLALGLYLLLPGYRSSRSLTTRHSLLHAACFTLGFFATLAFVVLQLDAHGLLAEAYYWTIGDHAIPFVRWRHGAWMTLTFVAFAWPLSGGTIASLGGGGAEPGLWGGRRAELAALGMLLLASFIGTSAGGRFYHHYYIQLIPPLALLAAPACAQVVRGQGSPGWWFSRRVVLLWLGGSIAVSLVAESLGLARRREVTDVGRYVRERSAPDERIFVWGQGAGIYLDARRRPASRYITTFPLTGYIFGWPPDQPMPDTRHRILPGAWATFEREVTRHPPRFIVDAEASRRPAPRYPMASFPFLQELVRRNYRLVHRASDGWIYERISGDRIR